MVINKYCTISLADLEAMRLSGNPNIQYPCMTVGCHTIEREVPPVSRIEKQQPIQQPDITTKRIDNRKIVDAPANEFIRYMQSAAFNQLTVSECYTSIDRMKEKKKYIIDCII